MGDEVGEGEEEGVYRSGNIETSVLHDIRVHEEGRVFGGLKGRDLENYLIFEVQKVSIFVRGGGCDGDVC